MAPAGWEKTQGRPSDSSADSEEGCFEDGAALLGLLLFLHFDLRDENAGGDRGHGYASRLSTADAVEHADLIVRSGDLAEGR